MGRKTGKELKRIKEKYNVSELWSWSRYNTAKTDIYEFFLKYIKNVKEDRNDSIYGVSGNVIHEIIEKFYKNELDHDQMAKEYQDKLFEFNLAGLKYDRCDEEKNEKIAKKYEECISHFFENYIRIENKLFLEKFIIIQVGKFIFQGYLDAVHKEKKNNIDKYIITDWKSSSLYRGKKVDKEKGQLVLYAEGLRQQGIPLKDIIIRWCFLKYVEVEYEQANGEIKSRIIERNEIGKKLKSNVQMWLKKSEYSELEVEQYLEEMIENNTIELLPQEIQNKFNIKDCYVEIPITETEIEELKKDIINTIVDIKKRELEYEKTKDDKVFWKEVDKEHSYFMANLSGYSRKIHKPYDAYLKELEMFEKENELDEEDLSWLNELD